MNIKIVNLPTNKVKQPHPALFKYISGIFLFLAFLPSLFGARIVGSVTDLDKIPLIGITVHLKSTTSATLTNEDGRFFLDVPDNLKDQQVTLLFIREGYYPQKKKVRVDNTAKTFKILFLPKDRELHEVSVTATNREQQAIDVPVAEHSVSALSIQEKIPDNVMDTLSDTPGVHFVGSGGYSVTPSIRGLARRRVLVLVDGARVTSDRRAGTSAGFIQPELSTGIEVVRSPASVLYGSDAIGGVINILTRPGKDQLLAAHKNRFNLNYNSVSQRLNTGVSLQHQLNRWHFYTGFQYAKAGDYSAPDEKIINSGYTYYSGAADISYQDEKREFFLGYIGGIGKDVDKPDRENDPGNFTTVPSESQQFLRMGYTEKELLPNAKLRLSLFYNPSTYFLEKTNTGKNTWERSETRGSNLGVKVFVEKELTGSLFYQVGAEWFSRQNLRINNIARPLDQGDDAASSTMPLDNGSRSDYSLFLTLQYSPIKQWSFNGGIRYTYFDINADTDNGYMEKNSGSYSFFVGVTHKITPTLSTFINVARAYRFPSLSESFYTGLTGRKYVIGNPLLEPETSWNIDAGLKYGSSKLGIGFYLFTNRVDHLIERYRNEDNIYTYDNIHRGTLYGGEIELLYRPVEKVQLFGHFFYYRGRSSRTDDPLNDIPAPRFKIGAKFFIGRLWIETDYLHSFKKSDPGPAEVLNKAYHLLDVKSGMYINSYLFIYMKISNLFNQTYYANPDPDIPAGKGIGISSGVQVYF